MWWRSKGLALLLAPAVIAGAYDLAPAGEETMLWGVVRFEGTPSSLEPLPVFKHPDVCGAVPDESLVIGPDQGVRYAVITLEGVSGGRDIERDVLNVLDNRNCRFVPHVLAASVGQWLILRNSDPIVHNADAVDLLDQRTLFNVGLLPNEELRQPLARPGLIRMTCDVRHTWMEAYVVVADHPYITVTNADGGYELRDVPPGDYTLRVWHERLGVLERAITVAGGASHEENFAFPSQD